MLTYTDIQNQSIIFTENNSSILIYKCWRFFYSKEGDKAPLEPKDSTGSGIPDYIELMLFKFETAKILLCSSFHLRDPLVGGFFYEKGVKFIDIYIKNIPREHGIASGIVYDEQIELLKGTEFQGKSLKITIHKNLIFKTATPIHELFHIFQFSYTHFNNMWFMEGLARWSQSIMQAKTGKHEPLPKNKDELDVLFHKLHDAEFFFNHLISLCEESDIFIIPENLKNNSEIYNNKKTGSVFMKVFLENCEYQNKIMQQTLISRDLCEVGYWSRNEKRSPNNNQYILKAIIDTVNQVCKSKNKELSQFIDLIYPFANVQIDNFNTPDIQNFLKVIQQSDSKLVIKSESGILYSEYFDLLTRTLTSKIIDFTDSYLTDNDIDSFKVVKRIKGTLIFTNCKKLTHLNGLNNLQSVDGDLILTDLKLNKLNELNNLETVNKLQISLMNNLCSISGINELKIIKNKLLIIDNPNLSSINGLNTLELISADISIKNNKLLQKVRGLTSLNSVKNIEILNNGFLDCNFLRTIFKQNKNFNGFIKICGNKIKNIRLISVFYFNSKLTI